MESKNNINLLSDDQKLTISQIAEQSGITIEELAEKTEIDPEHLTAVSRGQEELTACDLMKICNASGIDPHDVKLLYMKESDQEISLEDFVDKIKGFVEDNLTRCGFTVKEARAEEENLLVTLQIAGYPDAKDELSLDKEHVWRLKSFAQSIGIYHDGITPYEILDNCTGRSGEAVISIYMVKKHIPQSIMRYISE